MVIDNSAVVNDDLRAERARATFSTQAMTEMIWGDREKVERRRAIVDYVERTKELQPVKPHVMMSRQEVMESIGRLTVAGLKHMPNVVDTSKPEELFWFNSLVIGIDGYPFALQFVMALPTIMNGATDEQRAEWLPKMLNHQINCTYAQTEIGHGTNLKRLETTAVYDPSTEEFILNTPTVSATKFWPGNLGKFTNHAIIIAMLYTDGGKKAHGAHQFIVQTRDLETHEPLPGITIGDIGPKFAISANDNGFLRLDNVRVPRNRMLMKHAKVTKSGEYIRPIHSKVSYTGMMYVRSVMISGLALNLASCCTIAIRYSCVRRQGEIEPSAKEVQILDYQTQQHRLFPQLSRVFAFMFAGRYIRDLYFSVIAGLNVGDVSLLADLHALSSGLKSQVSYQVALGIEQCRMACGGHGYSQASGMPVIYGVAVGGCTYEGENMVMLLQVGRYLLKRAQEVRELTGDKRVAATAAASAFTKYFFDDNTKKRNFALSWTDFCCFLSAFEHLSRRLALVAYDRLQLLKVSERLSHERAWNETAVDWTRAARAHTRTFLARIFTENVEKIADPGVKAVVNDLLLLYLNYELTECSAGLLEDGYLNGSDMSTVRRNIYDLLKRIRPQAVSVVDAFEFSDLELNSVLGRKDGNVYENLLKWAQLSPLNETQVLPSHHKYIGRLMKERSREASKI